ncbi:hypothetical protein Plhal304r1_c046g0127931 [Plasmopara halstedii]
MRTIASENLEVRGRFTRTLASRILNFVGDSKTKIDHLRGSVSHQKVHYPRKSRPYP